MSTETPNETELSHRWRGRAWLRVEDGISWKVGNRACQPFAASSLLSAQTGLAFASKVRFDDVMRSGAAIHSISTNSRTTVPKG